MINVSLQLEEIQIRGVLQRDVNKVSKLILDIDNEIGDYIDTEELNQRFLEYFLSDTEMFLKIVKHGKLIGIFKGNIDLNKRNNAIIRYFKIIKEYRGQGIGSSVLSLIMDYLKKEYMIQNFYTTVERDINQIKFFRKVGFNFNRITKDNFILIKK